MEKKPIAKGEINYNAYDTWLEPYIGWKFDIVKITQRTVYFLMDNGKPEFDIEKHDKYLFTILGE